MNINAIKKVFRFRKSTLVRNSFWGVAANGIQSVLMSLFYVILARKYTTTEFSYFMIANSIYQFLAAISNLGLGQWFTREMVATPGQQEMVNKFLKLQLFGGFAFYIISCCLAFVLYGSPEIRILIILFGINIVFDNLIYAIKALNVAMLEQHITFKILIVDTVLKFLMIFPLVFYPYSIVVLTGGLIIIRFLTLNLFLRYGSKKTINLRQLWSYKISTQELKGIIIKNWPFLVISSVSIIYWRIGNIIISKTLTLLDVAVYEISFRLFSVAQILPIIIATTLYPHLIKLYNSGNRQAFRDYYRKYFYLFLLYGLFTYSFIYSFSDQIIPFVFGAKYSSTPAYAKEMFLTILLFPTAIYQAIVLTSMKLERVDMYINLTSLAVSIVCIAIGLSFSKSLSVINFSIFISFIAFHACQDVMLVRKGVASVRSTLQFYFMVAAFVLGYISIAAKTNSTILFLIIWGLVATGLGIDQWAKGVGRTGHLKENKLT